LSDGEENENGRLINLSNTELSPAFFLLYLNELTFGWSAGHIAKMEMVIEACLKDPNIDLVLLHEQDISKGGCGAFGELFKTTPQNLIDEPYNLNKDTAIPIYSVREYRDVILKLMLRKLMGSSPDNVSALQQKAEEHGQSEVKEKLKIVMRKWLENVKTKYNLVYNF